MKKERIKEALPEVKKSRRYTAVFGGTFDPLHLGHIALAEKVLEEDLADEIMFVPAGKPPHKLNQPVTEGLKRLEMLKLTLESYPQFALSDYEIVNKRKTSYTVNTLRALQTAFPERKFKLMLGMDNFLEFDTWHKHQEILKDFELIIFTRPGFKKISLVKITEKFGQKIAHQIERSILDTVNMDIASRQIRKVISESGDYKNLVLPAVAQYIEENGLYIND